MALRNFDIDLDDVTFEAALRRSQREGKTLDQCVAQQLPINVAYVLAKR